MSFLSSLIFSYINPLHPLSLSLSLSLFPLPPTPTPLPPTPNPFILFLPQGLGGDCFFLYYEPKTKTVKGINGSGRSPSSLSLSTLPSVSSSSTSSSPDSSTQKIPDTSPHSVTVPGAIAAWCDSLKAWGSGSLSLAEVLAPAIEVAEKGFVVAPVVAHLWKKGMGKLMEGGPGAKALMVVEKGGRSHRAPVRFFSALVFSLFSPPS